MPPTTDRREPTVRHSIRLVLLDEHDRLLLFSGTDEADGRTFWYPIGGGTEDGETPQQTAAREAHEETGLTDLVVGPEVWRRRAYATWGGTTYDCRERYFLARVPASPRSTSTPPASPRSNAPPSPATAGGPWPTSPPTPTASSPVTYPPAWRTSC
ncbi:NUDIX domain-containing protein [Nocardia sp. NPDC051833]|uniref:NUDIX domain-containing protein n=1 Tax=Nocardia sp. NPDC051833 TaxID=3155674 RepID=UPI00341983D2